MNKLHSYTCPFYINENCSLDDNEIPNCCKKRKNNMHTFCSTQTCTNISILYSPKEIGNYDKQAWLDFLNSSCDGCIKLINNI